MQAAIKVLFASSSIVVISKPSGLLCVPGVDERLPNAVCAVKSWLSRSPVETERDGQVFKRLFLSRSVSTLRPDSIRAAHRLDMATSGVIALAGDGAAHSLLSRMLQPPISKHGRHGPRIEKRYIALLDARLALLHHFPVTREDSGIVCTPLRSNSHLPILVGQDGTGESTRSRPCETRWRVLDRTGAVIRVELQPMTGRTHQLRLHAALPPPLGLGCPIIGDNIYGDMALTTHPYMPQLLQRYLDGSPTGTEALVPAPTSVVCELLRQHECRVRELPGAGLGPEVLQTSDCARERSVTVPSPVMFLHAQELIIPDWAPASAEKRVQKIQASESRSVSGTLASAQSDITRESLTLVSDELQPSDLWPVLDIRCNGGRELSPSRTHARIKTKDYNGCCHESEAVPPPVRVSRVTVAFGTGTVDAVRFFDPPEF